MNETIRTQLSYDVYLTYEESVTGLENQKVIINLKNNLNEKIVITNESISKDNKKYKSKLDAENFIKSSFTSIKGVSQVSITWDPWSILSYTVKITYDTKSLGPETCEGTIELKANIESTIKNAKLKFETIEYKSSTSAQAEVEKELKAIEGIKDIVFKWDDESLFKYNVKIEYLDDYFGPLVLTGTLKKYES